MPKGDFWTEQEDILLKNNYSTCGRAELSKILPGRTNTSIYQRATKRFNLKKDMSIVRGQRINKYRKKENFFYTPNAINSYWAGFIAADGYVSHKLNRVGISLSNKDLKHLGRFCVDSGYTGIISTRKHSGFSETSMCSDLVVCGARRWVHDLYTNFNIVPNKTKILCAPDLNAKNSAAYIVGYLDGDGCIGMYSSDRVNEILRIGIVGYMPVLSWIKEWVDFWVPETYGKKVAAVNISASQFRYALGGKRAQRLVSMLSKLQVPRLRRKWERIHNRLAIKYDFYSSLEEVKYGI